MKIFRVAINDESGLSLGYEYYSNKKDALTALKKSSSDYEIRVDNGSIQEREVVIGKYEILKLLNDWASHPDNG